MGGEPRQVCEARDGDGTAAAGGAPADAAGGDGQRGRRGLTQDQLLARLIELAGEPKPNERDLSIPTTGASLSRIETGKQNFNMATLTAIAQALDVDEPGWLLDRNPLKRGEVVDFTAKLDERDQKRALDVLRAMFPDAEQA